MLIRRQRKAAGNEQRGAENRHVQTDSGHTEEARALAARVLGAPPDSSSASRILYIPLPRQTRVHAAELCLHRGILCTTPNLRGAGLGAPCLQECERSLDATRASRS